MGSCQAGRARDEGVKAVDRRRGWHGRRGGLFWHERLDSLHGWAHREAVHETNLGFGACPSDAGSKSVSGTQAAAAWPAHWKAAIGRASAADQQWIPSVRRYCAQGCVLEVRLVQSEQVRNAGYSVSHGFCSARNAALPQPATSARHGQTFQLERAHALDWTRWPEKTTIKTHHTCKHRCWHGQKLH